MPMKQQKFILNNFHLNGINLISNTNCKSVIFNQKKGLSASFVFPSRGIFDLQLFTKEWNKDNIEIWQAYDTKSKPEKLEEAVDISRFIRFIIWI